MKACVGLALLGAPRLAAAQDYTHHTFLVPSGHFEITGEPSRPQLLRVDVSKNGPHPVSLAPHFYWGLSNDVTLGITHRRGFCLADCGEHRYNDVGLGLLVSLARSRDFELDLNTGLQARSIDPFHFGWKGGVLGRANIRSMALVFDPTLYVGFSHRDQGNREELVLPVWLYFQATPTVVPFVGAMVVGPLDGFADHNAVPVEGGVIFSLSQNVDLGAYFRFGNLLGHGGSPDYRELGMLARFLF